MSIISQIERIALSKAEAKTQIRLKGVSVPNNAKIDDVPELIASIPTAADNVCALRIETNVPIKPIIVYSAYEAYRVVPRIYDSRNEEKNAFSFSNVVGTSPVVVFFASPAFSFPTAYNIHKYSVTEAEASTTNGIASYDWTTAAHLTLMLNADKGSAQTVTIRFR